MSVIVSLNIWPSYRFVTLFIFLLISLICSTNARRNITIDSNNTLIRYVPASNWTWIAGSLDAGGGHMMTEDPNAYALINFTFFSYWIMSTRWPYPVTTQHTVDNTERILIDLQDHTVPNRGTGGGIIPSVIVARYNGSTSRVHAIRVSVPPSGKYAVLDRLIFEVEGSTSSTSTIASNGTQIPTRIVIPANTTATDISTIATNSTTEVSAIRRARDLSIAFGILVPLLIVVVLLLTFRRCSRRKNKEREATLVGSPLPTSMSESQLKTDSIRSEWLESHPTGKSNRAHVSLSDVPRAITTGFGPCAIPYIPSQSPKKTLHGPNANGSPRRILTGQRRSPFEERVVLGSWRGVPVQNPDHRPNRDHYPSSPRSGRRYDYF